MEAKEELLNEAYRPTYRAFRDMGLSESAAFEATLGRNPEADAVGTGLATDRLAAGFRELGLSEAAARHAAGGRRSTFERTRAEEIEETQRRSTGASSGEVRRNPDSLTESEKSRIARGEPITEVLRSADQRVAKERRTRKPAPVKDKPAGRRPSIQEVIEADIADIEAGRRPSNRLNRGE